MNRRFPLTCLCLCLLVIVACIRGQAQEGVKSNQTIWYGALDTGQRVFRFVIQSSKAGDGLSIAELMSLDEGGTKFKLDDVVMDDKEFRFALKSTKAAFRSQLSDDGKRASGKWSQGGANLDLIFEKRDTLPQDAPDEVWLGTLVAAGNSDVAWVVLMASPGVNGEDILYSQGQLIIAAEGGNEEARKRQRVLQEHVFAKAKELKPTDDVDPFVAGIVDKIIASAKDFTLKGEPEKSESDENERTGRIVLTEMVRANLKAMNDPWFRYFARYEPGPDLQKIKCPVLAINGEKDVQVDPKLNLPKIELSLRAGGNTNFLTKELPGLNHLFQTCKTGGVREYQSIEETISPLALESISEWLKLQSADKPSQKK